MIWAQLASDVLRWLQRRVRSYQDAEDLAGETVCRAWRRFRGESVAWRRLWAWALATARNLMLNYQRDLRRRSFMAFEPGTGCLAITDCGDAAYECGDFIHVLEQRLTGGERETAAMLRRGMRSNAAIARARGVTEREARRQRAALATKVAQLWRDS